MMWNTPFQIMYIDFMSKDEVNFYVKKEEITFYIEKLLINWSVNW